MKLIAPLALILTANTLHANVLLNSWDLTQHSFDQASLKEKIQYPVKITLNGEGVVAVPKDDSGKESRLKVPKDPALRDWVHQQADQSGKNTMNQKFIATTLGVSVFSAVMVGMLTLVVRNIYTTGQFKASYFFSGVAAGTVIGLVAGLATAYSERQDQYERAYVKKFNQLTDNE